MERYDFLKKRKLSNWKLAKISVESTPQGQEYKDESRIA